MAKALKNRATKIRYVSPSYGVLPGLESTYEEILDKNNRWDKLANSIPWDRIVNKYQLKLKNGRFGADGINPRVAIGSMIIKHISNLSDRDTIQAIQENVY